MAVLEDPINPLAYVLAYGAGFVAQGTPADMAGLSLVIEEAIRFPGFAFVNVQSPCVTYGEPDQQLNAQKARVESLSQLGHDPGNWLKAMERAAEYGTKLYTGVFYRNPTPGPAFGQTVHELQEHVKSKALPKSEILQLFIPS